MGKVVKKKIPQNNTRRKNNPVFVIDEILDLKDFKRKPITNTKAERLARALLDWAEQPDALRLHQFAKQQDIPLRYLPRLCEKSEIFAICYEEALLTIADRRELGGLSREYDPGMIRSSLAHYCPIAKEQAEFNAELKKKNEEDRHQVFHIVRDLGDGKPETITWAKGDNPQGYNTQGNKKDTDEEK